MSKPEFTTEYCLCRLFPDNYKDENGDILTNEYGQALSPPVIYKYLTINEIVEEILNLCPGEIRLIPHIIIINDDLFIEFVKYLKKENLENYNKIKKALIQYYEYNDYLDEVDPYIPSNEQPDDSSYIEHGKDKLRDIIEDEC